jgi:hypothetical protein
LLGHKHYPIGCHTQKRATDNAIIESPLNQFDCRNTENYLSYEPDVKRIANGGWRYSIIVCKNRDVSKEDAKAKCIGESGETVAEECKPFLYCLQWRHV